MKRPRLHTALLLGLALIAIMVVAGAYLNAKEGEMPKKILMYYGGTEIEEMFDATKWFASGMYKPRHMEADRGASPVTMLRDKPKPFAAAQYEELPLIASGRLRWSLPNIDRTPLLNNPPDLRQRVRYAYSAFAEPNIPVDYYYLYLELHGNRYVILFSRDAQSGDALPGGSAKQVVGDYAHQAEHRKAFSEIEEAERQAR